jgi:hypothetical protein
MMWAVRAAPGFRRPSRAPVKGGAIIASIRVCARRGIPLAFGFVKIVYRAENIIDANLVKAALAEAGIDAYVAGEYLTGGVGQLPALDLVSVMVADTDLERATPVAEAIDAALRESRDAAGDAPDAAFSPG